MYTFPRASDNCNTNSAAFDDFINPSAQLPPPPQLIIPDQLAAPPEFDSVNMGHSSSTSGCSSYGSPTQRGGHSLIQRSISNNGLHCCQFMSANEFVDMVDTSPVRRVFSTGDLHQRLNMGHRRSESPLTNESNAIIEGMNRACRYNPEEKRERIERYRSKRNQRNFNKKIKYACRKTLADSRPRIRGRFARNDEIEKNPHQAEWSHIREEEDDEDDDYNWINYLDSIPSATNLFS